MERKFLKCVCINLDVAAHTLHACPATRQYEVEPAPSACTVLILDEQQTNLSVTLTDYCSKDTGEYSPNSTLYLQKYFRVLVNSISFARTDPNHLAGKKGFGAFWFTSDKRVRNWDNSSTGSFSMGFGST